MAKTFQPGLLAASQYYGDEMGGKYLDHGNPYLDQIVHDSNADITDTVNQQFNSRFGSGYHAKALAQQLGRNEAALRYGNYDTERGRQDAAGGRLAGIATTATALPMIPAQGYSQGVGGLLGRYMNQSGTETQKQSGSLMDVIGMGLQAASLFSDARLKTDVRRVGQTDDGLTVYTYRYGGQGPFHMGVMAQEVRNAQPDALGPEVSGYMTVNYGEVR